VCSLTLWIRRESPSSSDLLPALKAPPFLSVAWKISKQKHSARKLWHWGLQRKGHGLGRSDPLYGFSMCGSHAYQTLKLPQIWESFWWWAYCVIHQNMGLLLLFTRDELGFGKKTKPKNSLEHSSLQIIQHFLLSNMVWKMKSARTPVLWWALGSDNFI
jgi:hypothetical protein